MNSPLLIENYSQGPSQGKLIFNIISFPHRSPKRQLILFALKSMEQLLELGFQGGAEPAGHLSCCTSTPSPHPKSFGTSRGGFELTIPRQVWFFLLRVTLTKLRGSSRRDVLAPRSPLELRFPGLQSPSQGRCFPSSRLPGEAQPWQEQCELYQTLFFISLSNASIFYLPDSEEELWHLFYIPRLPRELE